MGVDNRTFIREGKVPHRNKTQEMIMQVLEANPHLAFSLKDLESILNVRRQGIVQAVRPLENRKIIISGTIEENNRKVVYITLKEVDEEKVKEAEELERKRRDMDREDKEKILQQAGESQDGDA